MAYVKIRPRRGTSSQWEYANPVLSEGEMAFEVPDTGVGTGLINIKQGDGTTAWNNLPYAFNAATLNNKVDDLANTVATYDSTIRQVTDAVSEMQEQVMNIRKIDIQASEPSDGLVLGQIWIDSDMVTGSMVVTPRSVSLEAGGSTRLALTSTLSSVDSIEWKTSIDGIVALTNASSTGVTVTGIVDGTVSVTAYAKLGGATIYTATCAVTVSVSGALSIDPDSARVTIGSLTNLSLTNTLITYDSVQWTSSATYYASIEEQSDSSAKVKALTSGSATIYARAMLNGTAIATATSVLTIVGMKMNKSTMSLSIGESNSVALENTMIEGTDYDTITWTSSGNNVAYVSASSNTSATITGVAAGQATITATASLDGRTVQTVSCVVGVTGNIRLDKSTMAMMVGETGALTVTNTLGEGNYDRISWTSSSDPVARIDSSTNSSAIISARAAGAAVITVSAYLNSQLVSSSSCTVMISGTIRITEDTKTIVEGDTATLTLENTLPSSSYDEIRWGTNDSSIVNVVTQSDTECTIEGINPGQATITARAVDSMGTLVADSSCVVTVN